MFGEGVTQNMAVEQGVNENTLLQVHNGLFMCHFICSFVYSLIHFCIHSFVLSTSDLCHVYSLQKSLYGCFSILLYPLSPLFFFLVTILYVTSLQNLAITSCSAFDIIFYIIFLHIFVSQGISLKKLYSF